MKFTYTTFAVLALALLTINGVLHLTADAGAQRPCECEQLIAQKLQEQNELIAGSVLIHVNRIADAQECLCYQTTVQNEILVGSIHSDLNRIADALEKIANSP